MAAHVARLAEQIYATPSRKSLKGQIFQKPHEKPQTLSTKFNFGELAAAFPLPAPMEFRVPILSMVSIELPRRTQKLLVTHKDLVLPPLRKVRAKGAAKKKRGSRTGKGKRK